MNRRNAVLLIAAMVVVVGLPLARSSVTIARDTTREADVRRAAETWGSAIGWEVVDVTTREGRVIVRLEGPLPVPETEALSAGLEDAGVDPADIEAQLLPRETVRFGEG